MWRGEDEYCTCVGVRLRAEGVRVSASRFHLNRGALSNE